MIGRETLRMNDSYEDILAFAVAKERGARAFYRTWADRAEDEDVRQLLHELADDEKGHAQRLAEIDVRALMNEGPPPDDFRLADLIEETLPSEGMTLIDALAVAIQREQRAIELYERLRRHATRGEALFAALADDERRHKHRLELRYALLSRRYGSRR
jgi:rubrerythrin